MRPITLGNVSSGGLDVVEVVARRLSRHHHSPATKAHVDANGVSPLVRRSRLDKVNDSERVVANLGTMGSVHLGSGLSLGK